MKPSAYPIFLATEHIKTSTGLPSISYVFYTPNYVLVANPSANLSSSSGTAFLISILFPNTTIGTFAISGVLNICSNSFLDSSKRDGSAESIR